MKIIEDEEEQINQKSLPVEDSNAVSFTSSVAGWAQAKAHLICRFLV